MSLSGGQTKIFDQKLQWQAEAKIPKPERMSSLTQKLADVSVSDKPRTTRKLEEDAGANPFLTEEPEQLKEVAGAKELLSATQNSHLPHNEEELPALDIDSQDKDIEVSWALQRTFTFAMSH